jgi:hypothetical protein
MKHVGKATILSAALVLLLGTVASAAVIDINLYGASAQYLFWNDTADEFLEDQGCTASTVEQAEDSSGKHGITKGTCGADTVYVRYSSKASYDGIYSCKGELPPGGHPNPACASAPYGPRYREMADETSVTWAGPDAMGTVGSLDCKKVGIGASDVNGQTFGQTSNGNEDGHRGGAVISRNIPAIDTTGMNDYRPVVVPFGFFKNNAATGVTNLTRLQALMIYSGKAWYWDDFGPTYPNKTMVACLRHAGSGTHATLAAAVMRGDWPLVSYEKTSNNYIWFNDGSSDMMKCVDQNGGQSTSGYAAIGYADSDYLDARPGVYVNASAVDYNGVSAVKDNIVNGVYSFWSAQWLFECADGDATLETWIDDLATFASDATNLPASKANYWATQSEMNVTKANDFAMPSF